MPFIKLNSSKVLPFSDFPFTSLCREILCASAGDSPVSSDRLEECRRQRT